MLQFQYATKLELLLIFLGSLFAAIHGIGLPSIMIIFGDTIQSLVDSTMENTSNGSNQTGGVQFVDLENELTLQAYYYLAIGGGVWFTTYLQVSIFTVFNVPFRMKDKNYIKP